MEYHSSRFEDYSIIVKKNDDIVALLPANISGGNLISHEGLTYGGLLLSRKLKLREVIQIWQELLQFLNALKIEALLIKPIPSFYTKQPSEEVEYVLHALNATCTQLETAAVIDYRNRLPIQTNRLEGVKKANRQGLQLVEEQEFANFWDKILIPNLQNKYQTSPTHSLSEINLLHAKFPKNIRQFNVYLDAQIVGGATIFETETTAHVQYISANSSKQTYGTLDFLFHSLLSEVFLDKWYFDFGTSNIAMGSKVNSNLSYWKESFGARILVHKHFRVGTENYPLLNNVLV